MGLEAIHSINGVSVTPVNADEIGLRANWEGNPEEAELTVDEIVLAGKAKRLVLDHIATYGVFEGLPYTYQVGTTLLEYFIDLDETPVLSYQEDSEIEVTIKRRTGPKWFKENADALSFDAIHRTHPIPLFDLPYLIVRDNQLEMLILLGISTYTLTKALIEGIRDLITAITDFIKITFVGTGVPVGQIIAAALLLIARLIYVAALVIALIDLTKQIIELLFPPIRNFKASKVKDLFVRGCQKLGKTFESGLLDSLPGLTILPSTLQETNQDIFTNLFTLNTGSYTKGYPTSKDSGIDTLGLLLNVFSELFNAKWRIEGNVVRFERRDYWQNLAGLQIISTFTEQDIRENRYQLNIGDHWKRYFISYRVDSSDIHTLNKVSALDVELSTEPINVNNADLVNIKGVVNIQLPFAFGIRKDSLTFLEEAAKPFAKLADEVVEFFGGSSSLLSSIDGRIGLTQISQQFFMTPKLMYTFSGRQPANYKEIIGAPKLWDNYHFINNVRDNMKQIHSMTIPFSTGNLETLEFNNYVTDQNGQQWEVLNFEYIDETKQAEVELAKFSDEGKNTETIRINV